MTIEGPDFLVLWNGAGHFFDDFHICSTTYVVEVNAIGLGDGVVVEI